MLMRSKDYLFLNARNDLFTFEALKVQFLGQLGDIKWICSKNHLILNLFNVVRK